MPTGGFAPPTLDEAIPRPADIDGTSAFPPSLGGTVQLMVLVPITLGPTPRSEQEVAEIGTTWTHGGPKEEVPTFPGVQQILSSLEAAESASDTVCGICLEQYESGEELTCLPCAGSGCPSVWHADCIRTWLRQGHANACPLCRGTIEGQGVVEAPAARPAITFALQVRGSFPLADGDQAGRLSSRITQELIQELLFLALPQSAPLEATSRPGPLLSTSGATPASTISSLLMLPGLLGVDLPSSPLPPRGPPNRGLLRPPRLPSSWSVTTGAGRRPFGTISPPPLAPSIGRPLSVPRNLPPFAVPQREPLAPPPSGPPELPPFSFRPPPPPLPLTPGPVPLGSSFAAAGLAGRGAPWTPPFADAGWGPGAAATGAMMFPPTQLARDVGAPPVPEEGALGDGGAPRVHAWPPRFPPERHYVRLQSSFAP